MFEFNLEVSNSIFFEVLGDYIIISSLDSSSKGLISTIYYILVNSLRNWILYESDTDLHTLEHLSLESID